MSTNAHRPLKAIGLCISNWARGFRPSYPQGWRGRVESFGMALTAMSKGYQYDKRTWLQRLTDSGARYHFSRAFGASHKRALRMAGRV